MECKHEVSIIVGKPFNVGSDMVQKVKCLTCNEIGREYFRFFEKKWRGIDNE